MNEVGTPSVSRQAALSSEARPNSMRQNRTLFVAYWALTALHLTPLLFWPIPRSADLINHWARLTLVGMSPADPLNAYYTYSLGFIPNLAVDLIYAAAQPVLSPLTTIQLAWIASILLPASGVWRLNRALFGEPQYAVLLAPLLVYNVVVVIGLVNFGLGLGLALNAVALWLTLDRSRTGVRALVFNAAGVALFFCHIGAYALFAGTVWLIEAAPREGDDARGWLWRCLQAPLFFGLAAALWLLTTPIDDRMTYAPPFALLRYVAAFWSGDARSDLLALVGFAALAGFGLLRRHLRISPKMALPLAGLVVGLALIPSSWGAGSLLAARLNVFVFFLAVGSLKWRPGGGDFVMAPALATTFCVLRIAFAVPEWAAYEKAVGEFRKEIAVIQPGQRVLVVAPPAGACTGGGVALRLTFDQHLANFVIIDRRAMASSLFTGRGMQPVQLRDPSFARVPWDAIDASLLRRGRSPWNRRRLGGLARTIQRRRRHARRLRVATGGQRLEEHCARRYRGYLRHCFNSAVSAQWGGRRHPPVIRAAVSVTNRILAAIAPTPAHPPLVRTPAPMSMTEA